MTLNSGDSLDGGAGDDALVAVITGSVTPTSLTNIETVAFTTTTAATFDLSNATGVTTLTSQGATAAVTMSGIASDTTTMVRDTSLAHTVGFAGVTGSADSRSISVANVSSPTVAVAGSLVVAGVETLTINSSGSTANVLGIQASNPTAGALASVGPTTGATTTLNVTGAAGLTYGLLGSTITTVDASGLATSDGTGLTATYSSANAAKITGSAGNDSFVVGSSSSADSINAGAGADTIRYAGQTFLSGTGGDTIDGGDGTDALQILTGGIASIAVPTTYTVTNVETITVTDTLAGTYIPAAISAAATAFNITGSTSNVGAVLNTGAALTTAASTITGAAGSCSVGLGTSLATNAAGRLGAFDLTIAATGTAITDSVTVTNNARVTGGAQLDVFSDAAAAGRNLAFTGYETVNINNGSVGGIQTLTGTISVTGSAGGTSIEKLVVTGGNRFASGVISADIIDYSGITAAGTAYTATTAAAFMTTGSTATTITGTASLDLLLGNTSTASSIDGGAGADSIVAGSGNDTVLGSAGADTITAGSGNDSILGGADNDTIIFDGNLASGDVIDGGDGTADTLTVTSEISAAGAAGITNVEIIAATGAMSQAMTAFLNKGVTTLQTSGGSLAVTSAQDTLTTLIVGATATTPSLRRLVDSDTANALTLLFTDAGNTLTTPDFQDEETLVIGETGSDVSTARAIDLGAMVDTDLLSISFTGNNNHAATLTAAALKTVDASAATGTLNLVSTGSTVNMTVTGPASTSMTVVGGTGNDSITGGSAIDTITDGGGNDTVVGGAGADILISGTGSDSLVGGDGSDTYSAANSSGVFDGGSIVSTGVVVNLSSSALTAAAITTAIGTAGYISSGLTQIASNTAGYLETTLITNSVNYSNVGSAVDTLSSIENVIGSGGADYIVGSSSANTITAGAGIDTITGGSGIDTIILNSPLTANRDVVTDFATTASGDILTFDISDFALAGGTVYVGALAGLAAASTDEIFALTGVGYATDGAAETAIAGQVTTDGLDYVALYFNTTDSTVHVIYDVDAGVDGADAVAILVGTLSGTTMDTLAEFATIVAGNLTSQA